MDAALERQEWNLVLCDHSMPAFNSSAALGLLHERGFRDLPFIIVPGRIGEDVRISVEAERSHMINIFVKLGAHSRLQALLFCVRYGIVEIG